MLCALTESLLMARSLGLSEPEEPISQSGVGNCDLSTTNARHCTWCHIVSDLETTDVTTITSALVSGHRACVIQNWDQSMEFRSQSMEFSLPQCSYWGQTLRSTVRITAQHLVCWQPESGPDTRSMLFTETVSIHTACDQVPRGQNFIQCSALCLSTTNGI